MMKFLRIVMASAAIVMLAAGCESLRDGDPEKKGKTAKKEKTEKKRRSDRKRKRDRDPVNDMFFGLDGAKAEGFHSDNLSRREQSLLDEELQRQDEEMRDMKRMHREMDSGRSKRKEWVYGFKPLFGDK